jgi:hypothetical protein
MLNQYGSVLCIWCESSMRLATIVPGEAGTSMATFECRYPPCAESRVMVIGKPQLGQEVLSLEVRPVWLHDIRRVERGEAAALKTWQQKHRDGGGGQAPKPRSGAPLGAGLYARRQSR